MMNLAVKDAARLLAVSEKTIYRWIKDGSIPAYRIHDQYRFNRAELLEWATSRRIGISPEIFVEDDPIQVSLPSVVQALHTGGIFYRIGGSDKSSVLAAVVENMRLPDEVDRAFLYQVLLAREQLGSTGIGDGIAIPHIRNPIVLHLSKPMMSLCFLENPVDYGALDGKPVKALFTLVSPTVRAHLHMLSRLAYLLQDPAFKKAINDQTSREEILEAATQAQKGLPAESL